MSAVMQEVTTVPCGHPMQGCSRGADRARSFTPIAVSALIQSRGKARKAFCGKAPAGSLAVGAGLWGFLTGLAVSECVHHLPGFRLAVKLGLCEKCN